MNNHHLRTIKRMKGHILRLQAECSEVGDAVDLDMDLDSLSEIERIVGAHEFCASQNAESDRQGGLSGTGDIQGRAQEGGEAVGVIELSDYIQIGDSEPVPRRKSLTETRKGSIQDLPVGTKLYTHPSASVPDGQVMLPREFLTEYLELLEGSNYKEIHKLIRRTAVESLLADTPQPAPSVPDEWFHALRDCLLAWNAEADEGDGIMNEHAEIHDKADALVSREMRRRGFLSNPPAEGADNE